jgi:hypothetical protein
MPAIDQIGAALQGAPATSGTAPELRGGAASTASRTMRAIVQRRYGEPDVLACEQVAAPGPWA